MKDKLGLYYYPYPQNKRVRMYVLRQNDDICFRLWNSDDPQLWEQHGWVPYDAIQKAAGMYDKESGFDPHQAYDLEVGRTLLEEADQA